MISADRTMALLAGHGGADSADQRRAELIARRYVVHRLGGVHLLVAIRARYQRQDLWSCDALALGPLGLVGCQVTAAASDTGALTERRRKLEAIAWPAVSIVVLMQVERCDLRGRIAYRFRVQRLELPARTWASWGPWIDAPRSWWCSPRRQRDRPARSTEAHPMPLLEEIPR